MDPETDGDGAINLSTHHQPEPLPLHQTSTNLLAIATAIQNGQDVVIGKEEEESPVDTEPAVAAPAVLIPDRHSAGCSSDASSRPSSSGSSKSISPPAIHWEPVHKEGQHKTDPESVTTESSDPTAVPAATHPLLMTPQGLALQQHVQQMLRDQLIHPQLQSMLLFQKQQQEKLADLGRKQLESVMQTLQEQLQLNLIQQSQLMQQRGGGGASASASAAERRKSNELVQTLAGQQQQLMQQLQLTQRHYLIGLQQQQLLSSPPASTGEEAQMIHHTKTGWNKDAMTPLPPSTGGSAAGSVNGIPVSQHPSVRVTACESPASISPVRMASESMAGKTANGHLHIAGGLYSSPYQPINSTGDLNDNLIDQNGMPTSASVGSHPGPNNVKGGVDQQQQQRISSSSSTPVSSSSSSAHPLFHFGVCRWPGCESPCEDTAAFLEHLNREHVLDDRSTAQTRVQMQVVAQLELQLQKERDRLQSMMDHLNRARQQQQQQQATPSAKQSPVKPNGRGQTTADCLNLPAQQQAHRMSPSLAALVSATMRGVMNPATTAPHHLLLHPPTPTAGSNQPVHPPNPPSRRRLSEKSSLASNSGAVEDIRLRKRSVTERSAMDISEGLPYLLDRTGLDVHQELQRNREFYRNADVRPPFTYASLIRQAIIESPERQLTLNEIYTWFQNTFCYFRHNAATWKNAIRTNLSLHKCFVRYEDDFGSYWMVDDTEFVRRRHLARGRPRKFEIPAAAAAAAAAAVQHHQLQMTHPSSGGDPAVEEKPMTAATGGNQNSATKNRPIRSVQGVQSKSPSMTPSPTLFGEALNASLQAALAESNMNFMHRNPSMGPSPLDRHSNFHHHHHHHLHDGVHLALAAHPSASKRVKIESPDDELSTGSAKGQRDAPPEEYYCRNPAGGSSLVVVKQQPHDTAATADDGGHHHASETDNEDNNDASSTENYEPLDYKAWRTHQQQAGNPSNPVATNDDDDDDGDDDDDDEDDDGYTTNTISGRASLTVEVGPASSTRLMSDANAAEFLPQTVHSAK